MGTARSWKRCEKPDEIDRRRVEVEEGTNRLLVTETILSFFEAAAPKDVCANGHQLLSRRRIHVALPAALLHPHPENTEAQAALAMLCIR